MQITLPPNSGTKPEEGLYLYACIKNNCGKEPGSWRALRCQLESAKPRPSTGRPQEKQPPKAASALSTGGWGFDEASSESNSGGFDFSDLSAALDAMSASPSAPPKTKAKLRAEEAQVPLTKDISEPTVQDDSGAVSLPGFYLEKVAEGSGNAQSRKNYGGDAAAIDNAHLQELLERYEATQGCDAEVLLNASEGPEGSSTSSKEPSSSSGDAADEPSATWDGEGYEKDEVLVIEGRKGVEKRFLKFMKKLQRVPDQCVRLSRGGDILWPGAELPQPMPCSNCGAPREFSAQLMTPAISALEESAEWLEAEGVEAGAFERPPGSWDWATVAVYCCRNRCQSADKLYLEEDVYLISED